MELKDYYKCQTCGKEYPYAFDGNLHTCCGQIMSIVTRTTQEEVQKMIDLLDAKLKEYNNERGG